MFRSHSNSNNGLRGGVLVHRQRSAAVYDENAAPNFSAPKQPMSHKLTRENRRLSSSNASARRQSNNENATENRIAARQPMSRSFSLNHGTCGVHQRQELQGGSRAYVETVPLNHVMPSFEAPQRNPTGTRAFRDITNTAAETHVSVDKENKQGDSATKPPKALHRATDVSSASDCQQAKRRRQLPVSSSGVSAKRRLPSMVIDLIFEMAGLKSEGPEFAYADANLKTDLQRESQVTPRRGFMSQQRSLDSRMRAMLIDWIVQVLDSSRLSRRTLFLAVNIIDRCLSCMEVDRSTLQLLGGSAFLVAAKVEEIYPPEVATLVYLCDGAYTTDQFLDMECMILQKLDFCVDGPTVEHFLPQFIKVGLSGCMGPEDPILSHGLASFASLWHYPCRNEVAWYLAELALLDNHMSQYPPSQVSASVLYLANHLILRPSHSVVYTDVALWNNTMVQSSGYTEPMLLKCAGDLDKLRTVALSNPVAQQINRRHIGAVDAIRHAIFRPSGHRNASLPYAVVTSAVPYPC